MQHMDVITATWDDFGAAWSAIAVDTGWLVIEPVDAEEDRRHAELGDDLWCIVTSDNPQGRVRGDAENGAGRLALQRRVLGVDPAALPAIGGAGAVSDPESWPALESGFAVRVAGTDEAVQLCREFDQAAVYLLAGNLRILVDQDGGHVRRQGMRVHRLALQG
jgi:hypothetical protein